MSPHAQRCASEIYISAKTMTKHIFSCYDCVSVHIHYFGITRVSLEWFAIDCEDYEPFLWIVKCVSIKCGYDVQGRDHTTLIIHCIPVFRSKIYLQLCAMHLISNETFSFTEPKFIFTVIYAHSCFRYKLWCF